VSDGIAISGRQRNLLYKPTLDFLSVADDAYLAAIHGSYEEADRLGRQTCEELTFVLGDLRWRERQPDEVIRLVTPPAIVQRVVSRILDGAMHEVFEGTQEEIRKLEREAGELRLACEDVLAALPTEDEVTRKRADGIPDRSS
jgi:hypothetical protein